MQRVDLESATEFLLIAATLVELKARRLLPGRDDIELDEELSRFEERDLLLGRLLDCKTFQDAAKVLHARIASAGLSVGRSAGPEEPFRSLVPDPLERVSLDAFLAAALGSDHAASARSSYRPRRADPRECARRGRDRSRAPAVDRGSAFPRS